MGARHSLRGFKIEGAVPCRTSIPNLPPGTGVARPETPEHDHRSHPRAQPFGLVGRRHCGDRRHHRRGLPRHAPAGVGNDQSAASAAAAQQDSQDAANSAAGRTAERPGYGAGAVRSDADRAAASAAAARTPPPAPPRAGQSAGVRPLSPIRDRRRSGGRRNSRRYYSVRRQHDAERGIPCGGEPGQTVVREPRSRFWLCSLVLLRRGPACERSDATRRRSRAGPSGEPPPPGPSSSASTAAGAIGASLWPTRSAFRAARSVDARRSNRPAMSLSWSSRTAIRTIW